MKKKKILIIFGTRPEAIKLAPVIDEFCALRASCKSRNPLILEIKVCVTAQHRGMLDQVLNIFSIEPDYDLDLMRPGQNLTDITVNVLQGLREIMRDFKPDWVIVQGDTTTTFAAGLAAFYEKIAVAHVEAGLRTNNIYSPWPEEMNRKLVSSIAKLHFAPTEIAADNLIKENVNKDNIIVTGNTVIDALLQVSATINNDKNLKSGLERKFNFIDSNKKLVLVTGHRRESFGTGFKQICYALKNIAKKTDVQIIYPVHLNPNVQQPVNEILGHLDNVYLLEPQEYVDFVYLMNKAYIILTDSGGIQEEAPSLGKPVLVMRDMTERPEAVSAGTAKLTGANMQNIVREAEKLLNNRAEYVKMAEVHNPFGDGRAAGRVVRRIAKRE